MRGQVLLEELISFLEDKIIQLNSSILLYENLDETLNPSIMIKVFDQIEVHKEQIQNLDIRFVTKLDRFKQMNEVASLEALVIDTQEARKLFKQLKEKIAITQEKEVILKDYAHDFEAAHKIIDKGKIKAISAYKNINK